MLCGQYAAEEHFFYLACNMHWEPHDLALPKLPSGQVWVRISDTAGLTESSTEAVIREESRAGEPAVIAARSVVVYCSLTVEEPLGKGRNKKRKGNGAGK